MAEPSEDISTTELPQMEVASMKFSGPSEDYQKAYNELWQWIEENGYRVDGSPMEFWGKKPKTKDGKTIIFSEIQAPIAKT